MIQTAARSCREPSDIVAAANADFTAARHEFWFEPPSCLQAGLRPLLQDERDLPILYLFFNVLATVLPAALVLFALPAWSNVLGPVYFAATYALFLERFLLALHYSQHRRLFRTGCDCLNWIAPVLLSPLFGVPSGLYRFHHCVMHHSENNWYPKDLSSTEPYQRDHIPHFLIYWLRYLTGIWVELPLYAAKAKRWPMMLQCLCLEVAYLSLAVCLWRINRAATAWSLVIPLFVTSLALMLGNWSQHIFIDPTRPHSPDGMAYNCIQFSGNQRSFNDGYHTVHHQNSRLHWSLLPQQFVENVQKGTVSGLVFKGIGFFDVGVAIFLGKYSLLSKHLLRCGSVAMGMSDEDIASMLQDRLKPVHHLS